MANVTLRAAAVALSILLTTGLVWSAEEEYEIGTFDVLRVSVLGQTDLSGEFSVDSEGMLTFPFVGKVKASGLVPKDMEKKLAQLLKTEGYLKNPQVSVLIKESRSQRVFVSGELQKPGAYPLRADRRLLTLLEDMGPLGPNAGQGVVVTRTPKTAPAARLFEIPDGVLNPGDALPLPVPPAEIFKVNIRELQSGKMDMNIALKPGDTVQIQKAAQIYVSGHVTRPGPYRYDEGTTVLQALNNAGGVTEKGSEGRVKIVRIVEGKKVETKPKPTDLLQAEDMLVVPERIF